MNTNENRPRQHWLGFQKIVNQVLDLMRGHGWAGEIGRDSRPSLSLTHRDALLITYGDQVQEPGVVPFQSLASFLQMHLRGVVSGMHLLPFYAYSLRRWVCGEGL